MTPGTPVLQADGKTVLIPITGGTLAAGGSYKVSVTGVLDTNYNKIAEYTDTLKLFSDTTAPAVVKAELNASKVRVYFNEPVLATGLSVKVDGVAVAGPYTASTTAGVYYVETPVITNASLLSVGTHNVTVYDATDVVSGGGNKVSIATTAYTVTADTVAPSVVSISAKDAYTFKVKFSEPLAAEPGTVTVKKGAVVLPLDNTLDGAGNGILLDGSDTSNTTYLVKVKDVDANNKVYATGETSVNLSVAVSNYKDAANLIGSEFSGTVTLSIDTTAPAVVSTALNSVNAGTKTINVKFNEDLDAAVNAASITVKKDGIIIPVASAARNADLKSVDIVLTPAVTVGTYTVEFAAGAVKDAALNANAALTTTATYETAATPLVLSADTDGTVDDVGGVGIETADKNVITINFAEEMLDSAVNLANYKLDGAAFPAGTTIAFIGDKTKVKITLPAEYFTINTTARVTFSTDIKSKAGKVLAASLNPLTANEININFTDNKKPSLTGAKFYVASNTDTESSKIKLIFSENLAAVADNAATIADFNVTVNGVKATISNVTDRTAGDNTVVLQTAAPINLSQPVVVSVAGVDATNTTVDVTDVASNKLTTGTTLNVTEKEIDTDAIAADATAVANDKAALTVAYDGVAGTIALPTTGASGTTITWAEKTDASNVAAYTAPNVAITRSAADNTDETVVYTATITKGAATDTKDITFTVKENKAPTATLPGATNATTNDADSLVATFDEALYINGTAVANGADVKASFTPAGGTLSITSAIYDATAKTVTFTLATAADTNTITHNADATKLTDAAGNAYAAKVYTYASATTTWSSN